MYVFSQSAIAVLGLIPPPTPQISDMDYIMGWLIIASSAKMMVLLQCPSLHLRAVADVAAVTLADWPYKACPIEAPIWAHHRDQFG